jgi:hypothetical protein
MSTNKKIIIKATDYRYPTKKERAEIHKSEPPLRNFNFPYTAPHPCYRKRSFSLPQASRLVAR